REHMGRVRGSGAGDRAADIGLVPNRAGETDKLAFGKDRGDERHVGNMWEGALIGMVGNEHVIFIQAILPIDLKNAADEMAVDRRMEKHRRRNNKTPGSIENDTTEIAGFPDDGRIAGAIEMIMNLLDKARDVVADDLNRDRIHDHVLVRTRLR